MEWISFVLLSAPLPTFPGLAHLRIAPLGLVLGRTRCGDDRRIDNRATPYLQSARCKVGIHPIE
jgi:hypothetical protein